jgi:hypothetical protein
MVVGGERGETIEGGASKEGGSSLYNTLGMFADGLEEGLRGSVRSG